MNSLVRLVHNELMKMAARPGTWVMAGLLAVIGIVFTILWSPEDLTSLWLLAGDQLRFLFFVNTFAIIVAANIVAQEYSMGTIKLLLIRPVSRGKILGSKYLALLLFGLFLMAILWVCSLAIYGVAVVLRIIGFLPDETALPGKAVWFGSLGGALLLYGLRYLEVVVYGTLALTLSVLSKSNALSMGVTWMALIFGPEVTRFIAGGGWTRWMLFANLNLTQYLSETGVQRQFGTALAVVLFHMAALYWLGWLVFTKRDVLE